jgi:putative membrane protein
MRTRMALETTLAAWVRTATSLIAFGFAIVQFFENFHVTCGPSGNSLARYLGLVLIGIGSMATAIAVWEYRKVMTYLEGEVFQGIAGIPGVPRVYPVVVVAILLCLIGVLAFFTILFGAELPWPAKSSLAL